LCCVVLCCVVLCCVVLCCAPLGFIVMCCLVLFCVSKATDVVTQRGHPQEFWVYCRKLRAKTDLRDYNKFIMTCVNNAMEKLGKK